jgi:hypothetical protein
MNGGIARKSRASTHAQELVAAGPEINRAAHDHRQQTADEVSSSHTASVDVADYVARLVQSIAYEW